MEKVNVNSIMKSDEDITNVNYKGLDISVKKFLPIADVCHITENIVSACFGDDGTYMPELFAISFFNNVLVYYTNVEMPESADEIYALTSNSEFMETIIGAIDEYQIASIENFARDKISYAITTKSYLVENKLNEVVNGFSEIVEEIKKFVSNITPEDVLKIFENADNKDKNE